jgi:hypothetical protein
MKPKDILQHLEKGDRTLYHLTNKPEAESIAAQFRELSGMFNQAYGQSISQLGNTWTGVTTARQLAQNQGIGMQQNQGLTGGIIRW